MTFEIFALFILYVGNPTLPLKLLIRKCDSLPTDSSWNIVGCVEEFPKEK